MTLNCIRTGCQVFLTETREYVYGDAFEGGGFVAFNLVARSFQPINVPERHFTVRQIGHWWNEGRTSQACPTVLIAYSQYVINHGYDGVPDAFLRPDGGQRVNP